MSQLTSSPADSRSTADKLSGGSTAWQTPTCADDEELCSFDIVKSGTFGKVRQIDSVCTLAPDDDDELEDLDEVEELEELDWIDELAELKEIEAFDDVAALNDSEVTEVFKALDKNGDGLVMLSDVRRMLREAGADLTDDEFDDAFGDVFADSDGQIDIKRFGAVFLQEDCVAFEDASDFAPQVPASASASDTGRDTGCFAGLQHAARFLFCSN